MFNKISYFSFATLFSAAVSSTMAYDTKPYVEQPKYSDNQNVDLLVKGVFEGIGVSVSQDELKTSTRASDVIGKDVYSSDGYLLGRVYDVLFGKEGGVIFIISSGGIIPKVEIGDTERAIYSHISYLSDDKKSLHLILPKEAFEKERVVEN
jgi:sporulation protein YlmC with PRC-barrel domain